MVASEIPCLRARSAVFAPASCSFNTPIICSSVNLARFICPSFVKPDSNSIWRKYSVAGQAKPNTLDAAFGREAVIALALSGVGGRGVCSDDENAHPCEIGLLGIARKMTSAVFAWHNSKLRRTSRPSCQFYNSARPYQESYNGNL
jgi:hypothetical protein